MRIRSSTGLGGLLLTLGLTAASSSSASPEDAVATVCRSPGVPRLAGLVIAARPADTVGDLPYILITDTTNGATTRVYYAPGLRSLAESKAACWGGELRLLAPRIADHRRGVAWDAIAFVKDGAYVPPRGKDVGTRWVQRVGGERPGAIDAFLFETMPHEQVHTSQTFRRSGLPRWFGEGHAQWSGLQVTAITAPTLATNIRSDADARAASPAGAKLAAWGGTRFKPEAFLRQLSPEDQAGFKTDPTFKLKGAFHFGPGDAIIDNSDTARRYAAALNLFEGLEARHGKAAVLAWIDAVLASSNADIVQLAQRHLGEDISPLLK